MRIPRIYYDGELSSSNVISLTNKELHYVKNVLRRKKGDSLEIFNNLSQNYLGVILDINSKIVAIEIREAIEKNTESPLYTELGICLIKSDKMDLAIQKAVELGVNAIMPIYSERCNINLSRIEKKITHWRGIIESACAQSDRISLPDIFTPVKLNEWVNKSNDYDNIYFDPKSSNKISSIKLTHNRVRLLIGPEGGLSSSEINLLNKANWHKVSLGKRILRSETAVISALTLTQNLKGDM